GLSLLGRLHTVWRGRREENPCVAQSVPTGALAAPKRCDCNGLKRCASRDKGLFGSVPTGAFDTTACRPDQFFFRNSMSTRTPARVPAAIAGSSTWNRGLWFIGGMTPFFTFSVTSAGPQPIPTNSNLAVGCGDTSS